MYTPPSGTVVFSGRFDRPHLGHLASILSLGREFSKVHVVMLNYAGQRYDPEMRLEVLNTCLEQANACAGAQRFIVSQNTTHFGKLTLDEWNGYDAKWYAGGNWDVLKHMAELGAQILYIPRSWDYAATVEYEAERARVG